MQTLEHYYSMVEYIKFTGMNAKTPLFKFKT